MSPKQLYQTIRNVGTALKLYGRCRRYGMLTGPVLLRQLRLCREHQYEPVEAFRLGLFHPEFDAATLKQFLSRKKTTRLQRLLNPPAVAPIFKNKMVFYQYCRSCGLPIPRLYGLFSYMGKTIHAFHDDRLIPVADKEAFVNMLPRRFAIKPVNGSLGQGFRVMNRLPEGFSDHRGKLYSMRDFFSLMSETSPVGTLIQEVVNNHQAINTFSGVAGLQTIRVITLVDSDRSVEILTAFFKTIASTDIVIDTFIDDLKGNLEVPVTESGTLEKACYLDGKGSGIRVVDNHPVTGNLFEGFVIPGWPQVCELARHAALAALPARTIGWDIAVTPDGPCLIEGNIWWNPPNQHSVMARISERMNTVIANMFDDSN